MKKNTISLTFIILALGALLWLPESFHAAPVPDPNINVNGYFAGNKAQRGRTVQAAIVIEIPSGYHINSNRPLESYLIATSLKVDGPSGARIGPSLYPRAALRRFKFSKKQLSVY